VTLICLLGGTNLLVKGAHAFLPANTPPQVVLDNLVRFLSGMYFGMGFMMLWIALHAETAGDVIYFIGIVITSAGFGRLLSRVKVGSAGRYFDNIMIFEILLGIVIIVLQYLR
jgi:hypothetical protein